jgi:hypothetical protein
MMKASVRLLLVGAALALAGCGIANGLGVPHLIHEDVVGACRFCAEENGQICVREGDRRTCADFGAADGCTAAQNLFFQWEEEGPYLSPERSELRLGIGSRRDCDGQDAFTADVIVFDSEYDTRLNESWDRGFDPETWADDVSLIDAEGNVFHPERWESQGFYSGDGGAEAYFVEIVFCLNASPDDAVALQIVDKSGHHSNPLCFDPL